MLVDSATRVWAAVIDVGTYSVNHNHAPASQPAQLLPELDMATDYPCWLQQVAQTEAPVTDIYWRLCKFGVSSHVASVTVQNSCNLPPCSRYSIGYMCSERDNTVTETILREVIHSSLPLGPVDKPVPRRGAEHRWQ